MAITRTYGAASSGFTSGLGFAMANTNGSGFIFWRSCGVDDPGAGQPDEHVHALDHLARLAVAPPGFVCSASQRLGVFMEPAW